MNLKSLLEGIEIIRPYYDNPDGYNIGTEHDKVFMFATDHPVSPEDVAKLANLGWDQETDFYDQAESWYAYV